jgi:cytochrome c oxidase cbb3-type subunit 2
MAGELYRKPILFAIVSVVVILVGTMVTMFIPMMTSEMHPKLENLKPYTPLQLAGKDIYQREGCNNCHTQTVRPLRTEVMRYGEYSKAGEFAYDYPFLWGSKRTGPDLARIGKKYPDTWHYRHFEDPRKFHLKSNMPAYGWMKNSMLDPDDIKCHMDALKFPYTEEDISVLGDKNELDALVAYMQIIGTSVKPRAGAEGEAVVVEEMLNPMKGDPNAVAAGKVLYEDYCIDCHGEGGAGDIGPSLVDGMIMNVEGDLSDAHYFAIISNGLEEGMVIEGRSAEGGMPDFGEDMSKEDISSTITYIRSLQNK